MTSDWIKIRTDIYRDPKIILIADQLLQLDSPLARYINQNLQCDIAVTRNVMRNATVGALVSVWGIARHQGRRDGDDLRLDGVSCQVVDDIADMQGFGEAMIDSGWLTQDDVGLVFPKFFEEHNVDPREDEKEKNRDRQRRFREAKRNVTRNVTVTPKVTLEKRERREEKSTPSSAENAFVEKWNSVDGARKCIKWTESRRKAFATRIKDGAWDWSAALSKFPLRFTEGDANGWKPDVDWFLRPDSVLKILEGKYDWKKGTDTCSGPGQKFDESTVGQPTIGGI